MRNKFSPILILRIVMPAFLLVHGITRITKNDVGGFGDYLNGIISPMGHPLAWTLTSVEIIGSLLIIGGYFVPVIALWFIIELLMGIIMVHAANGWFVVGGGTSGMEYSILLILCYCVLFLDYYRQKPPELSK